MLLRLVGQVPPLQIITVDSLEIFNIIKLQLVKLHYMGEMLGVTPEQLEGIKSGNLMKLVAV